MTLGDTFWIEYLWVVLSDPTSDDEVVIVNLTSLRSNSDQTCLVHPGEHPHIDHDSVVMYNGARLVSRPTLERMITNGTFQAAPPVSQDLLRRIQQGALTSPFARPKIQVAVHNCLAKDDA